jgi:hypothetical protein
MLESSKQEELIRLFDKQLNNKTREKAALDSYMAFIEFIKLAMGEKEFNKFLTKHKVAYVEYVESLPEVITRKRFLKTTGVSATRFSGWELETKVDCHSSADNVCVKRRPREVT